MASTTRQQAIRSPGHSEARAVGLLLVAGALLVLAATVLATAGIYVSDSAGGYSALTRWIFAAVSLSVVMVLTGAVVRARARAAQRAQRFFELSNDMLCTMDFEGRCVDVNAAWERLLGYDAEELRGKSLLDITHPADRERARRETLELFRGVPSYSLETRVRARDGSWHWLRSSSTVARDEGLVYARSTDITELKRIEGEREDLLAEVQWLADSDALTGLPNRRVLDTQLPREMARARRQGTPLCVALIDIDRFKAFNDAHGHLAGDEVLRRCARAWDDALRAEDTIVRFGGEEFLVLLPDTELEAAEAVVERLRAATPGDQTCSAGLARWRFSETPDDLIGQADVALYVAKEAGRDRLVTAPEPE
ncbi:MAG TPA: diguanylate cyclase [Solirubrobacterales bacterium]